ncbi:MAG: MFS transporter [Candidatus Falkowbacteria bacterium]
MFNLLFWKKKPVNLNILYFMAFFLALAGALPTYIQSSYLENFVGLPAVTWFFITANLISILTILFFPRFIKKIGNYQATWIMSLLFIFSLAGQGLSTNPYLIFVFFILMSVAANLIWINMDIFVEKSSNNSTTGKTRTIYFTIINLAWIISPTISASLISLDNYSTVFLAAAILTTPFLLVLSLYAKKLKSKIYYKKTTIGKTLLKMHQNPDLSGIFWLSTLLNIFFNAATVFIPIYLNKVIGFSWIELGLMFSIMLIPFIVLEIPAGIIADKYLGEKEMLYFGYLIIIISLCLFSTSTTNNFWFWASLLFFSRIGASLLEAMRETYFFKKVGASDVDKINIFKASIPFGYLLGSLISLTVLVFLPINYIFIITALITCSAFPFLATIKDTK